MIVDNESRDYPCPHCQGKLVLDIGWYANGGAYHYLKHISPNGKETELKEV